VTVGGVRTNLNQIQPFFVTLNLFQGPSLGIPRSMRRERDPCVYILASGHYGAIYIGVTSNLLQRLVQHREGLLPGFTSRYKVHRLVHFEMFGEMERAIVREKQLKNWRRQWKVNLIDAENPEWRDLAVGLGLEPLAPSRRRNRS
jgi:putative endonuclease